MIEKQRKEIEKDVLAIESSFDKETHTPKIKTNKKAHLSANLNGWNVCVFVCADSTLNKLEEIKKHT